MFIVRALFVALLVFGIGCLASANEPQPKKPNPPKPNPQQPQQSQQQLQPQQQRQLQLQQQQAAQRQMLAALRLEQLQALRQTRLFMLEGIWNQYMMSRFRTPFVPTFAPPYAYLPNYLPAMRNNPTMPGTTPPPATSMAGFSRELVLELASATTYSQLKPGSTTQYQPAISDALKVGQVISVLAKNDPTAEKPGTWSFPCQITAIDDGDPKKLTVMAKLDPAQGEFNPDGKVITAVTIRAQPTVAQK